MTPQGRASRLPAALLLLWVPGCLPLSGPRRVTGTVGESLSVQCRYKEEFRDHNKYWCRSPCVLSLENIVKTTESEREVRRGRVSIRDRPATLTFTVTMEKLTADDEGRYKCGIDISWIEGLIDPTFQVVVSVSPACTSTPTSTATTTATTSTAPAPAPPVSTAPATNATRSKNSQDGAQPHPGPGLPVLLILLVLLLLILVGASLLACSMVRRRGKAGGDPEPLQSPCQTPQSEPCYANLELQMRPLRAAPEHPQQEEVEYSLVQPPREDLHYSSVVFAPPCHPEDQRPPKPEPEYSVIRQKT